MKLNLLSINVCLVITILLLLPLLNAYVNDYLYKSVGMWELGSDD